MSVFEDSIAAWKFLYKSKPRQAIIVAILFGAITLGLTGTLMFAVKKQKELEHKRSENYNQQLEALNNVQGSLQNLIQFVEQQKTKLKESEDIINTLKTEQEKLRPVVEADRETVNAILELQAQKQRQGVWWERGIGFILGILSSVLASAIFSLIKYLMKRNQASPISPATTS